MKFLPLALIVTSCATVNAQNTPKQAVTPNQVEMLILPPSGDPATVPPITSLVSWIQPDAPCNRTPLGHDPASAQINPHNAEIDDPFYGHEGKTCLVPLPQMSPGSYRAVAVFIAPECLDALGVKISPCKSARSPLAIPTVFSTTDSLPCNIQANVGEWTRDVPAKGYGRVSYSLLVNSVAITRLEVKFNGIIQDILTGSDLRHVAASYFYVGETPGTYSFTITAYDANGCTEGDNRPMTIVVN